MQNFSDVIHSQVFLLTDWQGDIWSRVYLSVKRDAIVAYTFDRKQAVDKKFPNILGQVSQSMLKLPEKRHNLKLQKSFSESSTGKEVDTSIEKESNTDAKKKRRCLLSPYHTHPLPYV